MTADAIQDILALAQQEYEAGKLLEAALLYKQAAERDPSNTEALYRWASVARERGNIENAERIVVDLLNLDPKHSGGLVLLGDIYAETERPFLARQSYLDALSLDEKNLAALNGLAIVCIEQIDDWWEAEEAARKGIALDEDYGLLRQVLAKALYKKGVCEEAIAIYEDEAKRHPEHAADNLCNAAEACASLADKERALEYYRKVVAIDPEHIGANCMVADFDKQTNAEKHIDDLMGLLDSVGSGVVEAVPIYFMLGDLYDRIGNSEKAFNNWKYGNALQRASYDYEISLSQQRFEFMKNAFLSKQKGKSFGSDKSISPIFIVGMPRSGSTLVEQILGAHKDVAAAGEVTYFGNLVRAQGCFDPGEKQFKNIHDEYLNKIFRHAMGKPYVVDKNLYNYFFIGLIHAIFPDAKIIHCMRDPMAVGLSIYRRKFEDDIEFAYDLKEIGGYYGLYQDLMDFWHKELPGFILDVRYEDVVADQEKTTREILDFCGLEWDENCLEFYKNDRAVHTASYLQVKKPIYKDSVESWRKYEKYLQPLKEALK